MATNPITQARAEHPWIVTSLGASRSVLRAMAALAVVGSTLAGCNGPTAPTPPPSPSPSPTAPSPTPTPTPTPVPTPPAQYVATPVPFGLTQSRVLDVFGWDSWPSAPTPSAIELRWNASASKYEVLAPGYDGWNRLEAVQSRFGSTPSTYDVFSSDGTKLPFYMPLWVQPSANWHVGDARIFQGNSARAYIAFGIASAPGEIPVSGTMTCSFGMDEIGDGTLTLDFSAGTLSGRAAPFWVNVEYQLVQTSFARGSTTLAATFGSDGVLEGRFFGPRATNIAIRAKGGGSGLAGVRGIMLGLCER